MRTSLPGINFVSNSHSANNPAAHLELRIHNLEMKSSFLLFCLFKTHKTCVLLQTLLSCGSVNILHYVNCRKFEKWSIHTPIDKYKVGGIQLLKKRYAAFICIQKDGGTQMLHKCKLCKL